MNEFIVVVDEDTEKRMLLPLSKILMIAECNDGNTFFELETYGNSSIGVKSIEKFSDILSILANKKNLIKYGE